MVAGFPAAFFADGAAWLLRAGAVGLRLSEEKTLITHIDEGLDFLGATRGRTARVGSLNEGLGAMTAA
jgi:hypothetical protein